MMIFAAGSLRFMGTVPKVSSLSEPILRHFKHENVDINDVIKPALSLSTANAEQLLQYRKQQQILVHQKHEIDTGSSAVQIAVMTERIHSLAKHVGIFRKDHSSKRGLQMLVHRRKRMMIYLRRKNFPVFEKVVIDLGLENEALNLPLKKKG